MRLLPLLLACGVLTLGACADIDPTMHPDYAIRVVPQPDGSYVAVPPECPSYTTEIANRFDNQPMPQFGCATARNLAMQVDQPYDLLKGRELGPANAVTTLGAMYRYTNNQTRGLMDSSEASDAVATTTSSAPNSALSGESLAGGKAGGSGGGLGGLMGGAAGGSQ